jgi:Cys-tRNA(Pro)/Cys-tRNA(Cys) deacylase
MTQKTNAARQLDQKGITYSIRQYDVDEADLSAQAAADKMGFPIERVFKTIVVRGDKTGVLLCCIPGHLELDLKALAYLSGNKKAEVVSLKEVQPLTGYIRGGVSPIGTKKKYPVFMDSSSQRFDQIAVSAGLRGFQISIHPDDLVKATDARYGSISK